MTRPTLVRLVAAILGALAALPVAAAPLDVALVSRAAQSSATAAGESGAGRLSGDGRFVFFLSDALDLSTGPSARLQLFRRELATGDVVPASGPANASPTDFSVSADGRWVAFASRASDLVGGDANGASDVFLRDLDTGKTRLVSAATPAIPGNYDSAGPVISADGRFVLFESNASNLAKSDANSTTDVFLHDVAAGTNRLVSARTPGTTADLKSSTVALSANGSLAVFRSEATTLMPVVAGYSTDLYIHDRNAATNRRVVLPGVVVGTVKPVVHTYNPVLSPDGKSLAFRTDSSPPTMPAGGVWWFDLEHGTNARVSGTLVGAALADDASGPAMSADGRTLAFESTSGRILVWNPADGLRTLDGIAPPATPADAEPNTSFSPVLSPDGSLLAFQSNDPAPSPFPVYIRRLATGATRKPLGGLAGGFEFPLAAFTPDNASVLLQTTAPLPGLADLNRGTDLVLASVESDTFVPLTPAAVGVVSTTANGPSSTGLGCVSNDGSRVLFRSFAGILLPDGTGGRGDLYIRDLKAGTTQSLGLGAEGPSYAARLSSNGRFVVFPAAARFADGDTNNVPDVYVRDLALGTTVLASAIDGTANATAGTGGSGNPVISADGRYVAFESRALDLVPGTAGSGNNVFLRDLATARTYWLSAPQLSQGLLPAGTASNPMIADDGQTVAFLGGSTGNPDLWFYRSSKGDLTHAGGSRVTAAVLAADGSRAAFVTGAITPYLFWHDVRAVSNAPIAVTSPAAGFTDLAISADGSRIAFASRFQAPGIPDINDASDVFTYDTATARLSKITVRAVAFASNHGSDSPSLSADGRFLAFRSYDRKSVDDKNDASDVYVGDLDLGVFALASHRPSAPDSGNRNSAKPTLSADGRTVVFVSAADDLVAGDHNGETDVFVASLGNFATDDADGDGLPDAWEIAWFGNLLPGPNDDADADGATNLSEYAAGTNPRDPGSFLHAGTTAIDANGILSLTFDSAPGVIYQLQYATALDPAGFQAVGNSVKGTGGPLTLSVPAADAAGFARLAVHR